MTNGGKRPFGAGWFRNDDGDFHLYDRSLLFLLPVIVVVAMLLGMFE